MIAQVSPREEGDGYLVKFTNGHEVEVHLEELLALCSELSRRLHEATRNGCPVPAPGGHDGNA